MYQIYTLLKTTEDKTFGDYGLTTEQGTVLGAIDYFGGPMKMIDMTRWLKPTTNSMSTIADQMVKAGLVRM